MSWTFSTGQPGFVLIGGTYGEALIPMCECGKAPIAHRVDFTSGQPSKMLCVACTDIAVREAAVANAPAWLEAAFKAVAPDQRSRLYRQLAVAFHPDTGGDARLMTALNAVRERFP
jgi:hypothetical protein